MSKAFVLLGYKLKSFFSPSYRGKYGPLPLIGLSLAFLPSGFGLGYGIGSVLLDSGPDFAINLLGSALSMMMVFGFIFALGVGVTAHPSELDFLMTAQVKPREYLLADMMFQFGSVTIAGGMAILTAVVGLLLGLGEPLWLAGPVFLVLGLYAVMMFMVIQAVTVIKIRHLNAPVRLIVLLLLLVSVLPMASLASSDFPVGFSDIPAPQSAFAFITYDVLTGSPLELEDIAIAAVYMAAIVMIWVRVSNQYFFYGVKPTLSGGFGQVDVGTKMAQQKRMIGGFGGVTTKIPFRTEKGGDLSFMTRLNLIRFWRDGSFIFVALLLAVFVGTGVMESGSADASPIAINLFQAGAWPIAILALNWCYYERENLWIPVVGGKSLVSYFRGLMMSLVVVGLGIALVVLAVLMIAGVAIRIEDVALVVLTPISDAAVASMLLTRIRAKPGAFSPGLLAVLFGTILAGAAVSGATWWLIRALDGGTDASFMLQAGATVVTAAVMCFVGLAAVTRLSRGFKFS